MGGAVGKTWLRIDHAGSQFFTVWGDRLVAAVILYCVYKWQVSKRFPKPKPAIADKQEQSKQEHSKQEHKDHKSGH